MRRQQPRSSSQASYLPALAGGGPLTQKSIFLQCRRHLNRPRATSRHVSPLDAELPKNLLQLLYPVLQAFPAIWIFCCRRKRYELPEIVLQMSLCTYSNLCPDHASENVRTVKLHSVGIEPGCCSQVAKLIGRREHFCPTALYVAGQYQSQAINTTR
jgi:hypothetical protein